jgi:protein involved in polysaccharide export with SLBB domain
MRSINVYVVGAAYKPGTYTVSSMASLTNIVFASGGPNREGSLRNILVKRKGVTLSEYDFYDLILNGDTSKDIRLQEGDTIFYPLIRNTIKIEGSVQRPGFYEFKQGDTVSSIFKYSGLKNRSKVKVELSRYDASQDKRMVSVYENLSDPNLQEMLIVDDDSISIIASKNVTPSTVRLGGEFLYPGIYDISSGETILGIIQKAGGMTEEAYPEASIFTRAMVRQQQKDSFIKNADNLERSLLDSVSTGSTIDGESYAAMIQFINRLREVEPTGRQVVSVDSYTLRADPKYNFALQDGDVLIVPKRSPSVSVVGEVLNTTTHIYDEDLSIDDYIQLSGGTTQGADLSKIFVILPNGQAALYKSRLFQNDVSSKLLPGSTIVVSRNPDPFDWLQLTSIITPILSDLAVSAAAIAAISDNN